MKYQILEPKFHKHRRGTALVETEQGILVVAGSSKLFLLPGGAANRHESRLEAAIRELKEETGLKAYSAKFLFSYTGGVHECGSRLVKDYHKVFLIEAEGKPKPCQEIKKVEFYQQGKDINLSKATETIIQEYFRLKETDCRFYS